MPRLKSQGNIDNKALMSLAKRAVQKTREVIPYSENIGSENFRKTLLLAIGRSWSNAPMVKALKKNPFLPYGEDIEKKRLILNENKKICLITLLEMLQHSNKSDKHYHKDGTLFKTQHFCENLARKAAQIGVGNCGETSFFAFNLLLEKEFAGQFENKIRVEIIFLKADADHGFVLLNRAEKSVLKNMSSWGEAIIIDPWAHVRFSVEEQLMLYKKDEEKAKDIFCHIYENLKYAEVYAESYLGSGHSKRFCDKGRMNFFQMPAYDKKEEPYQFVDVDENTMSVTQSS